jgi:predicted HTH domain antitoxin
MYPTMDTLAFPTAVPENFERSIEMTRVELDHHLRLMAALKMFELGQISSGKAAELVGTTRVDFLQTCGRYHVSVFNYPPEEAEAEIRRELEAFSQYTPT